MKLFDKMVYVIRQARINHSYDECHCLFDNHVKVGLCSYCKMENALSVLPNWVGRIGPNTKLEDTKAAKLEDIPENSTFRLSNDKMS